MEPSISWVIRIRESRSKNIRRFCWHFCPARIEEAVPLYQWMLPVLRMDTVVRFVQLIKLQQNLATGGVGELGNNRVRPPRLELVGAELAEATATIEKALASAPDL
jgi:4-hydroxy-tetrahydrodipicolinate synthase